MPESKWGLKEGFWCFHTSGLIFTGKEQGSFYILFDVASALVLHSTDLGFGLAQNFHVV